MNEKAIKVEVRLYAVEFFVATLFAIQCVNVERPAPTRAIFGKTNNGL
jgi:hypothetical protein